MFIMPNRKLYVLISYMVLSLQALWPLAVALPASPLELALSGPADGLDKKLKNFSLV
jgi:hypothetical protein